MNEGTIHTFAGWETFGRTRGLVGRPAHNSAHDPAWRVAWIAVFASFPVIASLALIGILAYILFGEVSIGLIWFHRQSRITLLCCSAERKSYILVLIQPPSSGGVVSVGFKRQR